MKDESTNTYLIMQNSLQTGGAAELAGARGDVAESVVRKLQADAVRGYATDLSHGRCPCSSA